MKDKTSLTLSRDVLKGIDRIAGSRMSRSAVIDRILRKYLNDRSRAAAQADDLRRINVGAERLNEEAAGVLEHQSVEIEAPKA
jgi:metal-responsive CopG/Arc/MetJ family transcriptional regulator